MNSLSLFSVFFFFFVSSSLLFSDVLQVAAVSTCFLYEFQDVQMMAATPYDTSLIPTPISYFPQAQSPRVLNTINCDNADNGIAIGEDGASFIIASGTCSITAHATVDDQIITHRLILKDITDPDNQFELMQGPVIADDQAGFISAMVTVTAPTTYTLEHTVIASAQSTGFLGYNPISNFRDQWSTEELYMTLEIRCTA